MSTSTKPRSFIPEKHIHINPQSKGNIGKSTETENRTCYFDYNDIGWRGSDLDDSHRTFAKRHPEDVDCYTFGDTIGAKDVLMAVHNRVRHSSTPIHIVDSRAQAHTFLMGAMEELDFFNLCRDDNIQVTLFLFLSDEIESMESIRAFTKFGKGVANFVVVDNPARSAGKLYHGSAFEKSLMNLGAGQIKLPTISTKTLLGMQAAEKKASHGISFAEFATAASGHLEPSMVKDIQWNLMTMYDQYDKVAHLMVPPTILAKIKARKPKASNISSETNSEDDFGFNI